MPEDIPHGHTRNSGGRVSPLSFGNLLKMDNVVQKGGRMKIKDFLSKLGITDIEQDIPDLDLEPKKEVEPKKDLEPKKEVEPKKDSEPDYNMETLTKAISELTNINKELVKANQQLALQGKTDVDVNKSIEELIYKTFSEEEKK